MTSQIPKAIRIRLRSLLRRVRLMQAARGVFGLATVLLGGLLVVMAADYFLAPLPLAARWGMFLALVVAAGAAGWAWLWKPLTQRISLVNVALWLESRHPEIQERISTAVELSGQSSGASEELLQELIASAGEDVEAVDPAVEVGSGRVKRWLYPASSCAAVLALLLVVWPDETGRLLVRAVAPFSTVGNAGAARFEITPGDMEVLEGDKVNITIVYEGRDSDRLNLVIEREGGERTEESLARDSATDGERRFSWKLPAASESFKYHVRSRKAQSDIHAVTVYPSPLLEEVTVGYAYPPYTGKAPQSRPWSGGVEALAGTEVRLQGRANTAITGGRLMVDGKEHGPVTLEAGSAGRGIRIDWRLMPGKAGLGQVFLDHRVGREVEALRFPVKVRPDEPPKVTLLAPVQRQMKVRPDELIVLQYVVVEDIGLSAVAVEVELDGGRIPALPANLPGRHDTPTGGIWPGKAEVDVGDLAGLSDNTREIRMRLMATDVLPREFEGPGIGYSDWLTLRIDRHAEPLARQQIRSQQRDALEAIEETIRDTSEARQQMGRHRESVKEEEMKREAKEQLAKAREKLAKVEEDLERLAERMERGVQAARADEVRDIGAMARESREHLEDAPLQDDAEGRRAELDLGREAARETVEALQDLHREISRDGERLEDLARLSELAQREREAARQAGEKAMQEGPEAQAGNEWQRRQRDIEQQVRQQMREDPQSTTEMLERQADRAGELAKMARELSEKQEGLGEAVDPQGRESEQSKADESRQEMARALEEQLEREQSAIVNEAKEELAEARQNREERADLLPEAVGNAEETLEAMRDQRDDVAVEAAREAAEGLEELAVGSTGRNVASEGESADGRDTSPADSQAGGDEPDGESEEPGEVADGSKPDPESGEVAGPQEKAPAPDEVREASPAGEQGMAQGAAENGEFPQGPQDGEGDAPDPDLAELAERQGAVAEALGALQSGDLEGAMEVVQEMQAVEAGKLAGEIEDLPQISEGGGPMAQAASQAKRGETAARQAAREGQQGASRVAARQHGVAAEAFGRTAEALQRAASQFAREAESAAGQQPARNQLPLPAETMADALEAASEASDAANAGEAARASREAAQALSQAARQAMQGLMSGQPPGQPPGRPGQPGDMPGDDPQDGFRPEQGAPGVPPELARLGVSSEDWEKLQSLLRSDVGGIRGADVPEDYRALVRRYFEEMAKGTK